MIEQVMVFVLGLLTAGLLLIALLPALWRRAVRLTRQALEASLPLSPDEIAAEKDQIRAAHAIEIRRIETGREATEALLQSERVESGARLIQIQQHEATIAADKALIAAREATIAERDSQIDALTATIATLEQERDNLVTNLTGARMSNQALDEQSKSLRQTGEQRLARIGELESSTAMFAARLAETQAEATRFAEDARQRGDDLRQQVQRLRELEAQAGTLSRKLAAAEALAASHAATIAALQAERLALIDEAGLRTRERDHEHIERQALAAATERLERRHAEATAQLDKARASLAAQKDEFAARLAEARDARRIAERDLKALRSTLKADDTEREGDDSIDVKPTAPGPQPAPAS